MTTNLLEPGEKIKPIVDIGQAKNFVEKQFNFNVIKIIEMDSYDDRNYLIEIETDYKGHGKQFVVKITNSLDSATPGLIEAINDVSYFIKSSTSIKVPYAITDPNGNLVVRINLKPSEQVCALRLMAFVPGTIMNQIVYVADILFQVGQALGELTKNLKEYNNPVLERRQTIWSLLNVDKLSGFLSSLDNDGQRSMIKDIIEKFVQKVLKEMTTFRTAIIHGDVNEQNIIVDKVNDKWSFVGFIDFGDTHKAPIIFDLAILCCYITLDCRTIDPLEAPKHVISGYQSVIELTDQEWNVLPICMLARFAQSVTLGAYSYRLDPSNKYILSSAKKIWAVLERMVKYDDNQLKEIWKTKLN